MFHLHVRLVRINILGPRNDEMYNMRMFVKHFLIRKVHMYFKYQTKGIILHEMENKIKKRGRCMHVHVLYDYFIFVKVLRTSASMKFFFEFIFSPKVHHCSADPMYRGDLQLV